MSYRREIHVTDTGMVVGQVFAEDGSRVGLKFFTALFNSNASIERRAKKANAWADEIIRICNLYEVRAKP